MSSRQLPDVIRGFLKYTEHTESPKSYMVWSAISTISSVLERRCYMDWAGERIYPNQYIILVGNAGLTRKNLPIMLSKVILTEVGCNLTARKITHEKLIQDLAAAQTEYMHGTKVVTQNPLTVISPELSVFLRFQESELLATLTDLWESGDNWSYATKGSGVDIVIGPCLSILGATAPEWLGKIFPPEAVGGGLTSRCLFVYEKRKGRIQGDYIPLDPVLFSALIHDLREIHGMVGDFTFDDETRKAYVDWYVEYETLIQEKGRFPIDDPKLYSYVARRATHIKKLCMALSASEGSSQLITISVWRRAIRYLTAIEKRMSETFENMGQSKIAPNLRAVWDLISRNPAYNRADVLNALKRDLDLYDLQRIESMLVSMNYIKLVQSGESPTDVSYKVILTEVHAPEPSYPV